MLAPSRLPSPASRPATHSPAKFLVCGGSLSGEADAWGVLARRVAALQASQHGPFEALLVSGPLFATEGQYQGALRSEERLGVPTFLSSVPSFVGGGPLPENVHRLGRASGDGAMGIETVCKLTVAYLNTSNLRDDTTELEALRNVTTGMAYRGCDVLLSDDWPTDMHHFLDDA